MVRNGKLRARLALNNLILVLFHTRAHSGKMMATDNLRAGFHLKHSIYVTLHNGSVVHCLAFCKLSKTWYNSTATCAIGCQYISCVSFLAFSKALLRFIGVVVLREYISFDASSYIFRFLCCNISVSSDFHWIGYSDPITLTYTYIILYMAVNQHSL